MPLCGGARSCGRRASIPETASADGVVNQTPFTVGTGRGRCPHGPLHWTDCPVRPVTSRLT